MDYSSDTESDSSKPATREYAYPTQHTNSERDWEVFSPRDIRKAIHVVNEWDTASVLEDASYFVAVQESSAVLLHFLNLAPQLIKTRHIPQVVDLFTELGRSSFLQRLFKIRKYFRLVAHQEQGSDPHSTALTCVDVVLAKISLLAMPLAVGPAIYDSDRVEGAEWVQLRRDNDIVRAATQLPDSWMAIDTFISSNNVSPAARRVAMSLAFIAYVMVRQIDPAEASPLPPQFLQSLYTAINQTAYIAASPSTLHFSHLKKVQLAMLVSLFASVHTKVDYGALGYTSQLRPEGFGHILELIQGIVSEKDSSFRVLENVDPAQCILLRWGNVVPWSWSVWNDQRIANTECLRSVTATWLLLLNKPLYGERHKGLVDRMFRVDLKNALLSDASSSSLMVLQLLQEVFNHKYSEALPGYMTTEILVKLCWAAVQFLEAHVVCPSPQFEGQISEICRLLVSLFPAVEPHNPKDNLVRTLIVEALVLAPSNVISSTLWKVFQNKEAQFISKLDSVMQICVRVLSEQRAGEKDYRSGGIGLAKCLLDFASILSFRLPQEDSGLQGVVSSFLRQVADILMQEGRLNTFPLRSFLIALSALRNRKTALKTSDENICLFIMNPLGRDLCTIAAFAQYMLSTSDLRRDSLLRHEIWRYLLGELTKIVEQNCPEEEPVALLVAPTICYALNSVLSTSNEQTRKRLSSTPWALSTRLSLQDLLKNDPTTDLYSKALHERLRIAGQILLKELLHGASTGFDDTPPQGPRKTSLNSSKGVPIVGVANFVPEFYLGNFKMMRLQFLQRKMHPEFGFFSNVCLLNNVPTNIVILSQAIELCRRTSFLS